MSREKVAEHTANLQFVQEIQKHPCLYNNRLTGYARKDVSEAAWTKVGQAVGLSVSGCKEKWKNLRAVYVRSMKQPADLKRPYYLSDAMHFILPFVRALNPKPAGANDSANVTISKSDQDVSSIELEDGDSDSSEDVAAEIEDYFKAKRAKTQCAPEGDLIQESRRMFLLSLLPDVIAMNDQQMRAFRRRVLAIIDDVLQEPVEEVEGEHCIYVGGSQ